MWEMALSGRDPELFRWSEGLWVMPLPGWEPELFRQSKGTQLQHASILFCIQAIPFTRIGPFSLKSLYIFFHSLTYFVRVVLYISAMPQHVWPEDNLWELVPRFCCLGTN